MSFRMGKKIIKQKHRFVGIENGPVNFQNVGHIVDLSYVPNDEKGIVIENVAKGARSILEADIEIGIIFLNT